jgi:hypothetical protein
MIKKVLLALITIIILFFGARYSYQLYKREQCQAEMESNRQNIKDLVDLGSLIVSHVKYQNQELQSQQDIKEFVSTYLKVRQVFSTTPQVLYESREDLLYYLEILPVILKNEEYFEVVTDSSRPTVPYQDLVKQMQLRSEKISPMPSCQ